MKAEEFLDSKPSAEDFLLNEEAELGFVPLGPEEAFKQFLSIREEQKTRAIKASGYIPGIETEILQKSGNSFILSDALKSDPKFVNDSYDEINDQLQKRILRNEESGESVITKGTRELLKLMGLRKTTKEQIANSFVDYQTRIKPMLNPGEYSTLGQNFKYNKELFSFPSQGLIETYGKDDATKASNSFFAGLITTSEGITNALAAFNIPGAQEIANEIKLSRIDLTPKDPRLRLQIANGFGSMLSFFVPGIGAAKGASLIAKVSPKMAKIFGVSTMAITEGMTEAGFTYSNVLEKQRDEGKAFLAAAETFWLNMPLLLITDVGYFQSGKGAFKVAKQALTEGLQEGTQEAITGFSQGTLGDMKAKDFLNPAIVGAVTGGGVSIAQSAFSSAQGKTEIQQSDQIEIEKTQPKGAKPVETVQTAETQKETKEQAPVAEPVIEAQQQKVEEKAIQKKPDTARTEEQKSDEETVTSIEKDIKDTGLEEIITKEDIEQELGTSKQPEEKKRIISDELYNKSVQNIKKELSGFKSGVNPLVLSDYVIVGAYHIENGINNFKSWSETMIGKYGEKIRPQLKDIWGKANDYLKARVPKDTKKRIRQLTGQTKIGDFFQEEDVLKASIKKAEQAARKAFSEGKKEGIDKTKKRYIELKIQQKQKDAIKKIATRISRKVPKSIDFFYREAIENLQSGIDPSFRTKKTLESRERTRMFLENSLEALKDIPIKLLQEINKKPLNEYTIDELREIDAEITRLKKQGGLKRKLAKRETTRQFESDRDKIVTNILSGKKLEVEKESPVVFSTTKKGVIKKLKSSERTISLRPQRIFDKLDGGKNFEGETVEVFYDRPNEAENKKLTSQETRLSKGKAKLKELKLKLSDLLKKRKIDGVDYMIDEMIDVYMAVKNPRKHLAVIYGNNIKQETIEKIIKSLTPKEKSLGDFIIEEYAENYPRYRNAHIELTNEDMGNEENYSPIIRQDVDYKTLDAQISDELLHRYHLKRGYVEKGSTIKRKDIPTEFQKPIRLGAYTTWLEHVPKQEHYIYYAPVIKNLRRIAEDSSFGNAVKQQFGNEYLKIIKNYIDRIANPNIYRGFGNIEKIARELRKNASVAYLAYNAITVGKQIPSVFLYLRDARPAYLISSMAEFSVNPFGMINMAKEKDPQIKFRSIERELEEMKDILGKNKYNRMVKKVGKNGMIGIRAFDRIAITIGWHAVYNRALANGKSEAEAINLAQKATLRTQPAAHAKDISELYATNEFLNWFTQFSNQLNQIYNIATYDIPADIKQGKYYNAFLSTLGISITALFIWALSHRRLPEDREDLIEAAKDEFLSSLPLVGRTVSAVSSGFHGTQLPPSLKPAESLGIALSSASFERKFRSFLEGVSVAFGYPYIGVKRVKRAIQEEDLFELIGGGPIK